VVDRDVAVDDDAQGAGGQPRTLVILAAVVVFLLGVLPVALLVRDAVQDPVYAGLDALNLPSWSRLAHEDHSSGNRFCLRSCELRERTYQSAHGSTATDAAFRSALQAQGWQPVVGSGCPTVPTGRYSCWQRDQYVLDLWTRDASCITSEAQPQVPAVPTPTPAGPRTPSADCPAAQASIKVAEAIDPHWHH
jgi:hypothetical protein